MKAGLYLRPSAVAAVRYAPGRGIEVNEVHLIGGGVIPCDDAWALSVLEQLHQAEGNGQRAQDEHGPTHPARGEALMHLPLERSNA